MWTEHGQQQSQLSVQGFSTSIIGAVPYTTVRLALFDGLKAVYRKVWLLF